MRLWRLITLLGILVGAVGSMKLMFDAGRDQKSIFLMVLFTGWVLAPFIVSVGVTFISHRWPASARAALYGFILILCTLSLVAYKGALDMPGTKPAFKFLIVPLVSLVLILTAALIFWRREKTERAKSL